MDDLSDPENIANDDGKNPIINQEEVVCEVEDLLQLAMDERKGKLEAIKVDNIKEENIIKNKSRKIFKKRKFRKKFFKKKTK